MNVLFECAGIVNWSTRSINTPAINFGLKHQHTTLAVFITRLFIERE